MARGGSESEEGGNWDEWVDTRNSPWASIGVCSAPRGGARAAAGTSECWYGTWRACCDDLMFSIGYNTCHLEKRTPPFSHLHILQDFLFGPGMGISF